MKDSIKPSNDGNESDKAVKVIENKNLLRRYIHF